MKFVEYGCNDRLVAIPRENMISNCKKVEKVVTSDDLIDFFFTLQVLDLRFQFNWGIDTGGCRVGFPGRSAFNKNYETVSNFKEA